MEQIEVELRSFLTKSQFLKLLRFFKRNAKFLGEDYQVTYYFDAPLDLRIQKGRTYAKIWMKSGKIHEEKREEIEIFCKRDDFSKLEKLFISLGYKIKAKWYRKRRKFRWEGVNVMLDYTRGYGYIIELEKVVRDPKRRERALKILRKKFEKLGINPTPKKEFDKKYKWYLKNWRRILKS